jgi:uncharacterized SAM-binding protein YcdF (DUF218 family)
MRNRKLCIVFIAIFGLLLALAITHSLWLESIGKFLIVSDELYPADVLVILGGGGQDRVDHGVKLYKSGYASKIIITGMPIQLPGITTTWPNLAMNSALSMGVPENAIIIEERPTSTYEDAEYVKEDMIKGNLKSAIIVSSAYHIRRARMIFKKVFNDQEDVTLMFSPSDSEQFQIHRWWTREDELIIVVIEYCKLVRYFFKYII